MFEYQKERERERELLRLREELLKSILSRTTEAYSTVKRARRLLRAQAIDWGDAAGGQLTRRKPYDLYLAMISDAQQELVNLYGEIKGKREFSDPKELRKKLRQMKSYLGSLIGEYEKFNPTLKTLPLANLPLLEDFTVFSKDSNFKKQFDNPFHGIQRSMRKDLLHPRVQPPCLGLREAHGDVVDRSPDAVAMTNNRDLGSRIRHGLLANSKTRLLPPVNRPTRAGFPGRASSLAAPRRQARSPERGPAEE
jgi:hypothetical protein